MESAWSVIENIIFLLPWNPHVSLSEINIFIIFFWVQAHGLPLGKMNKDYAEQLATNIGDLIEINCVEEGMQLNRSFLGFRVAINIKNPLVPVSTR